MKNSRIKNTIKNIDDAIYQLSYNLNIPIDIIEICKHLNIIVSKDNSLKLTASGSWTKDNFSIKIYPQKGIKYKGFTFFERFLIAHEIGHYILREINVVASDKSDYRKHEDICNYFARALLIPEDYLKKALSNIIDDPKQYYNLSLFLENKTKVNWKSVAHRLSEINKAIAFFEIQKNENNGTIIYTIDFSTLPKKKLKGLKIKNDEKSQIELYQEINKYFNLKSSGGIDSESEIIKYFSSILSDYKANLVSGQVEQIFNKIRLLILFLEQIKEYDIN